MAEVNVENMEENAQLFEEKMGFAHTADGLDMTDDQLVNFLLLCHHDQYDMSDDEEYEEEDMEMMDEGKDVKVKVMKLGGGSGQIMDDLRDRGALSGINSGLIKGAMTDGEMPRGLSTPEQQRRALENYERDRQMTADGALENM